MIIQFGVDDAVSVIAVPAAWFVYPSNNAFVVMFALESRNTTELAPLDVVTPVPPFATGNVPDTWVVRLMVPVRLDAGNAVMLTA